MPHLDTIQLLLGHFFSVIGVLFALVLFSRMMARHRHAGTTMAWMLFIIFIPYVGIPAYLLLGGRKLSRMAGRKRRLNFATPKGFGECPDLGPIASAAHGHEHVPPACHGNHLRLVMDPVHTWREFIAMLEEAKETIHIMTFILAKDDVAREVIEVLARKAREGVKVRLLLDAVGSFGATSRFVKPLKDAGGEVGIFMPMLSLQRRGGANLRNHRKIFIIDHRKAMIGGRNIGREYMGPARTAEQWEDSTVVIEGPAVHTLNEIFAADWNFATDEPEASVLAGYDGGILRHDGTVSLQIVASGPDVATDAYVELMLAAMFQAKKRVWIVTPYFVPDNTLLRTLIILARIGRDVTIVTPRRSDRILVDLARRYYLRELFRAGANIYLYNDKVLHSKVLLIDDEIAVAGSANMDMRSFYLNYEVAAFVYTPGKVREMADYVVNLLPKCSRYTRRESRVRGWMAETLENLSRLMAPLL